MGGGGGGLTAENLTWLNFAVLKKEGELYSKQSLQSRKLADFI